MAILNRVISITLYQRDQAAMYLISGFVVKWVQTLAMLEIVHSLVGT